jgi:hypothetical protein
MMVFKGAGEDQQIYYSIFDMSAGSWGGVVPVDGAYTSNVPSLWYVNGYFLIAFKGAGEDQQIYYSIFDINTKSWGGVVPVDGAYTSNIPSLSLVPFSDIPPPTNVLMAFKGAGEIRQIYYSIFDINRKSWGGVVPVGPGPFITNDVPSSIAFAHRPRRMHEHRTYLETTKNS